METQEFISLSQIGLYNPQRMSDEVMQKLFIARQRIFLFLTERLKNEAPNSIPQHHLIIAQRGMGKTTLLKRIEVELRQNADYKGFIPLLYPEEQYNLSNLAELWLNSLDAMADTLQVESRMDIVREIDAKVREITQVKNEEEMGRQAHRYLMKVASDIGRRPVLLIDNLNLVFDRLQKPEQHILRSLLMQNKAPILIGASAVSMEETYDYGAPFYDAFQMHYLSRLAFEELLDILKQLAILTNAKELQPTIQDEIARIKTIHQLTGGNPRTAVMLFRLIVRGFSKEINDDLEALLDEITPLYKARFEELSPQNQKIVDVIALHWDPMHLELIRRETRLDNGQLSPQLKRLVEVGWLEKSDAYQAKGSAYSISERFFNIWFLMRRSSRRQKKEILCLSKFLESFYDDRLPEIAQNRLGLSAHSLDHITYDLAMAEALKDKELSQKLKNKSHAELRKMAETQPDILERFGLPAESPAELDREKILLDRLNKNPKNVWGILDLGHYYRNQKRYEEAKDKYLEYIKINDNNDKVWHQLGHAYDVLNEIKEAERAYLKALSINKDEFANHYCLGLFYYRQGKYTEALESCLECIKIDYDEPQVWSVMATLYGTHLEEHEEAEKAYLKAIELGDDDLGSQFNGLGNLYQDHFQDYQKAEKAYLEAISLDDKYAYAKYNLVFLYRDKLNKIKEAKELFDTLSIDKRVEDSYWLNKTLFSLYDKNEGIAIQDIEKAFAFVEKGLLSNTQDDWFRFGAVATKLGYGAWFLRLLEKKGLDVVLAPYYVAIRAMNEPNQEGYLMSRAIELREPARKIIEKMKQYLG